jgi:hypothetical protein
VRALVKLRGDLGVPLLLRDVFMAPTARALAVLATARSLASLDNQQRERLFRSAKHDAGGDAR